MIQPLNCVFYGPISLVPAPGVSNRQRVVKLLLLLSETHEWAGNPADAGPAAPACFLD